MKQAKKNVICSLCGQKTDIYTDYCKNNYFIDNKKYEKLCFSCFYVPKDTIQKYDSAGNIKEDLFVGYSCENLNLPKEIYFQGSSSSLKEAKISYEKVFQSCAACKTKNKINLPKPKWIVI